MFKINNKNMSMTSFWCFVVNFEQLHNFSSLSIADFEQVNVSWG